MLKEQRAGTKRNNKALVASDCSMLLLGSPAVAIAWTLANLNSSSSIIMIWTQLLSWPVLLDKNTIWFAFDTRKKKIITAKEKISEAYFTENQSAVQLKARARAGHDHHLNQCNLCISTATHPFCMEWELEPIPANDGWEVGYNPDRSPARCSATHRDKQPVWLLFGFIVTN